MNNHVKIYQNADLHKVQILKENRGKAGVYRWTNLLNGCTYIGSSRNLGNRMKQYFSITFLERELKKGSSIINASLLKNGYSNFTLEILEYCEPDKCLEREDYYFKKFKPDYNIAKDPTAPMSGRKHSEKTKQIMSETENSGRFKTGHKHLDEARKKMSEAKLGKPRPEVAGRPYQAIEVFDIKNNLTTHYESLSAAAIALDIKQSVISTYFVRNQQKPFKGRYLFRK